MDAQYLSDKVMFGILLIASMFSQGLTIVSYGDSFITAFPENLGYFYPFTSNRTLRVTALENDTCFTVYFNNTEKTMSILQNGTTATVTFPKSAEVNNLDYSANSIRITSTKNVVVHAFSQANIGNGTKKSAQTAVVQPITNLGTHYLIPSLNYLDLIQTFSGSSADFRSKRYSSFKLIIINAEDTENTITIVKTVSLSIQEVNFKIPPYQLIQIQANDSLLTVKSSSKVAVMLTHPCLEITDCTCKMIMHHILPTQFQGQKFVVPYIKSLNQSRLLMTSEDKSPYLFHNNVKLQPSSSGFMSLSDQLRPQYVNATGNVSLTLISPGVFIELIPENMFAGCYLLHLYSGKKRALVIAETDSTHNVHIQYSQITDDEWTEIKGTKYSSTIITLTNTSTYIWHSSSKFTVYILENSGTEFYGGPAIPISEKTDEFGCGVIPGQFEVRDEFLSWTESLSLCTSLQKHLACPTMEDSQMDLANAVNTTEMGDGWIGLRRSLMTTEWYWQRETPSSSSSSLLSTSTSPSVDYVHWADGQPLDSCNGLCASLSLDRDKGFKWKSAKCCEKKHPVCYKPPTYLTPLSTCDSCEIIFL